ncbi:MAG: hypothetical protein ACJ8DV_10665, partial [Microvirga sp.]
HWVMGRLSLDADNIGGPRAQERAAMDYYAGLDVSMNETHICVVVTGRFRPPSDATSDNVNSRR